MKNELMPRVALKQTYVTTLEMRAKQLAADIFSTPAMIGLMEGTCVRLVAPYLDENEQTVGIHVDVRHFAPTKIGQKVTITAKFLELSGNKLRFAVSAVNDRAIEIGKGTHRRALIDTTQFAGGSE